MVGYQNSQNSTPSLWGVLPGPATMGQVNNDPKKDQHCKLFNTYVDNNLNVKATYLGDIHPNNFKVKQGLCWAEGMEKEANVQINPNTIVRLKARWFYNLLKDEYKEVRNRWMNIITAIAQNSKKCKTIDSIKLPSGQRLRNGQYEHDILLGCIKMRFKKYVDFKIKRILKTRDGKNIILYDLANKVLLIKLKIKDVPCTCHGEDEPALEQILPIASNTKEVICYNSCQRTLFAAYKRQLQMVFSPDPQVLKEYEDFVHQYFDEYVKPVLRNFDYSYSQWFNRMPRHKQDAMIRAKESVENKPPKTVEYGLFCKREKQEAGGKNRAIANIDPMIKHIMGPICWALESIADKHFPGYCGMKNWDNLEDLFEVNNKDGFSYVLQGDGSAFDTCQHYENKLIDRLVYEYIADQGAVHHCDPKMYKRIATAQFRTLNAKQSINGTFSTMATAEIEGTVFSGASDTTLMNTLRMATYNMFTLQRAGMIYNHDFKLLAKGDDFMIFSKTPDWNGRSYEDIYYDIWAHKPSKVTETDFTKPYGIGQILKFMIVGDYSSIDFCSTTCIPYENGTRFKLARKPERMDPLAHYSRAALRMSPGQLKQYLNDQAYALRDSVGPIPFYEEYAKAYEYWASQIDAEPTMLTTGRERLVMADDNHKHIKDTLAKLENYYYDYGHDYIAGLANRHSEHKIPAADVLDHLLYKYKITEQDIAYNYQMLTSHVYNIYDGFSF